MAQYCQNCGKEIKEEGKFCSNCGSNLSMIMPDEKLVEIKIRAAERLISFVGRLAIMTGIAGPFIIFFAFATTGEPIWAFWFMLLSGIILTVIGVASLYYSEKYRSMLVKGDLSFIK